MDPIECLYTADCVEWNPIWKDLLLVGTYQLGGKERFGSIETYQRGIQDGFTLVDVRKEDGGVFDVKFSSRMINGLVEYGEALSNNLLRIVSLKDEGNLEAECRDVKYDEKHQMCVSLDWSNRVHVENPKICVSHSSGDISVVDVERNEVQDIWNGHELEAWIAAWNYYDPNQLFSGSDDCLLKFWDIRALGTPTRVCKNHEAGVCSIHSHPLKEHVIATGSYDEYCRIWDLRSMKYPVHEINCNGGVWRLKWHPTNENYLLAACMRGGWKVLKLSEDSSGSTSSCEVFYEKDLEDGENLAYGVDWDYQHLKKVKFGGCSFYDKKFYYFSTDEKI